MDPAVVPALPRSLTIGERRPLREDVRDALVSAIIDGDFQPGERIVESRVARHLRVSQTTVREALREIEQLGLVVSSLNRGVVVRPLTRRAVLEMYEMRALLEGYAARRAVERLTDADLTELENMVAEMVRLSDAGDVREMIACDVEFHTRICALADHTLLVRLWASVNPHLWTYVAVRGLLGLPPGVVARRHEDVLAALRTGDPERAEQAMHAHLLELREQAAQHLHE